MASPKGGRNRGVLLYMYPHFDMFLETRPWAGSNPQSVDQKFSMLPLDNCTNHTYIIHEIIEHVYQSDDNPFRYRSDDI